MSDQASTLDCVRTLPAAVPKTSRVRKLLFDVSVALTLLLLLSPLLLLVCVLIKVTDRGPVLFKHTRIGLKGRPFGCLKFRTMILNSEAVLADHLSKDAHARAEWAANHKLAQDPRVTPLGKLLRATSLDELPQLFNIISGDMSLVGPRPITESELPRYGDAAALYLAFRPGLTGLWQISGRSNCTYEERVQLDAQYVREWSLRKDMLIMLLTIPAVLSRRGSC
jgi:exopolysaccharide production protein ExoY